MLKEELVVQSSSDDVSNMVVAVLGLQMKQAHWCFLMMWQLAEVPRWILRCMGLNSLLKFIQNLLNWQSSASQYSWIMSLNIAKATQDFTGKPIGYFQWQILPPDLNANGTWFLVTNDQTKGRKTYKKNKQLMLTAKSKYFWVPGNGEISVACGRTIHNHKDLASPPACHQLDQHCCGLANHSSIRSCDKSTNMVVLASLTWTARPSWSFFTGVEVMISERPFHPLHSQILEVFSDKQLCGGGEAWQWRTVLRLKTGFEESGSSGKEISYCNLWLQICRGLPMVPKHLQFYGIWSLVCRRYQTSLQTWFCGAPAWSCSIALGPILIAQMCHQLSAPGGTRSSKPDWIATKKRKKHSCLGLAEKIWWSSDGCISAAHPTNPCSLQMWHAVHLKGK